MSQDKDEVDCIRMITLEENYALDRRNRIGTSILEIEKIFCNSMISLFTRPGGILNRAHAT